MIDDYLEQMFQSVKENPDTVTVVDKIGKVQNIKSTNCKIVKLSALLTDILNIITSQRIETINSTIGWGNPLTHWLL